ncbi:hypothetical protein D3C79_511600 [compost metagenome]
MGAEQHADEQVSEDHRLAEAPEDRHQQDGGEQQDQYVCIQWLLPFISRRGGREANPFTSVEERLRLPASASPALASGGSALGQSPCTTGPTRR